MTDNREKQIGFHLCVRLEGSLLLPGRAKDARRKNKDGPHSSATTGLCATEGRVYLRTTLPSCQDILFLNKLPVVSVAFGLHTTHSESTFKIRMQ